MDLTIEARLYEPSDYETCLGLFRSNVPAYFAPSEEGDYREFLDELFGEYFLFEAEENGALACGGIYVDERERWVGIIWTIVRNDLLGKGIGRGLMEHLLERIGPTAREYPIYVDTSQHTRAFFEKLGFKVYEEWPDGYAPGLHRYDMRLDR